MSFLVRRRQRDSIRAHASVSGNAIALVLETIETGSYARVAPIVVEPRVRDSEFAPPAEARGSEFDLRAEVRARAERLSEQPPLLVETTTCADSETVPPVSESWRVRAANKAYGAIAPEKAADATPRCSRRC